MVQAPIPSHPSAAVPTPAMSASTIAATNASIAKYLAAGERMRVISGWVAIACLVFMVVFVLAMAVGIVPVTIRPL